MTIQSKKEGMKIERREFLKVAFGGLRCQADYDIIK